MPIKPSEALYLRLLLRTPYVVLCKSDCKGLYLICNLNEEDCGHAAQIEQKQERKKNFASNPFAALKNLVIESDSEE